MNTLALVLVLIAFSGTNVLAAGLPKLEGVKSGAELSQWSNGNRLEQLSTNFADPGRGSPPDRNGGGNGGNGGGRR